MISWKKTISSGLDFRDGRDNIKIRYNENEQRCAGLSNSKIPVEIKAKWPRTKVYVKGCHKFAKLKFPDF